MQLGTSCSGRAAAQLLPAVMRAQPRALGAAVRALHAHVAGGVAPAAPQGSALQGSFLGRCAALRTSRSQHLSSRGFRSTVTTMGLKTGIVGLPNVGKVRRPGAGGGLGGSLPSRPQAQAVCGASLYPPGMRHTPVPPLGSR